MREDDDFDVDTDEDPVFAAITPRKINKWGYLVSVVKLAQDLAGSVTDFLCDVKLLTGQRFLWEQEQQEWAGQVSAEIENLQGFYIPVAVEGEEDAESDWCE